MLVCEKSWTTCITRPSSCVTAPSSFPVQTSVRQHAQILAALEKGERQRAARLMVEHIRTVRDRLLSHLATQPVQRATTPDDGNPVRRRPGLEGKNGHPGRLRKRKPTPAILSSPAT